MRSVADYELIEQLQPGNHGTFHLARPPARLAAEHELVAVKILDRHATDNEFKRMAAELRVLLAVDHPRLVEVIDAGHEGGRLFYVTPYYREGGLALGPCEDVAVVAMQVADAADAAHALHENGVAHRDIKPSNILLAEGRGHLSDLGVANYADANFTATGSSPVGTLAYADPRLIHGDAAGRASDIWSLGATLHAAVTGESVIGTIPTAHLAAAIEYVLGAEARIAPGCPESVAVVVARATEPEQADRYPTAADFADALRSAVRAPIGASVDSSQAATHPPLPTASPGDGPTVEPVGILVFDDGRSFVLRTTTIIGRSPELDERVAAARAVPLALESEMTMSRVHLVVEVDGATVRVTDVSANGTHVVPSGASAAVALVAGEPHRLRDGDTLLLGSLSVVFNETTRH